MAAAVAHRGLQSDSLFTKGYEAREHIAAYKRSIVTIALCVSALVKRVPSAQGKTGTFVDLSHLAYQLT